MLTNVVFTQPKKLKNNNNMTSVVFLLESDRALSLDVGGGTPTMCHTIGVAKLHIVCHINFYPLI